MEPALLHQEHLIKLSPAEPLWQRVPTKDDVGRLLGDFMMVIPQLKNFSPDKLRQTVDKLNKILELYREFVVFADLNLRINVLWISHRQGAGIGLELAAAIHALIPEAKLVAQHHE